MNIAILDNPSRSAGLLALPLVDTNSAEEVAKVQEFIDRLAPRVMAMNGTFTGEHGVGQN